MRLNRPYIRRRNAVSPGRTWRIALLLGLVYTLVLQAMLPGTAQAARAAALAGLPAQLMLCQPGAMADESPAAPASDGQHGEVCCMAACPLRLADHAPPADATPVAYPADSAVLAVIPAPVVLTTSPLPCGPISARGPPLFA